MAATNLIQEFNHLGGSSSCEHTRNFFTYMKKLTAVPEQERLNILEQLTAHHRQEELFLTKLLLEYEQTDKLKQLLLHGNRILNKVIMNHHPFIFRNETSDYFLNELFPNVSYVVRMRCLNNLAKVIDKDDIGEDFFRKDLVRYGIKTAQILLPVCGQAFIREILIQYRVIFSERQLVRLHRRFGFNFLQFYYAECAKYGLRDQFAKQPFFAKYIAAKDIQTFGELLKYGIPKIGWRSFIRFVNYNKAVFLKDPNKYAAFIKPRILYKILSREEYRTYVFNKLPNTVNDFSANAICDDLKMLNIKDRGNFLADIFVEKYDCQMYIRYSNKKDSLRQIDFQLPGILSREDMLKFEMEEDERLAYLPTSEAFPLIFERIDLTSNANSRCELILQLFYCARNNNDEDALYKALKYFNHKHGNDKSSIRKDIFNFMKDNYKMEKLGADVWECLHELFLAEQMLCKYDYNISSMMAEECLYKFLNNLDFSVEFKMFVKHQGQHYLGLPSKNKDLQRWALLHLPEVCPEIFKNAKKQIWPREFLCALQDWNLENPKDHISCYDYPGIIKTALALEDNEECYYDNVFPNYVLNYQTKSPEDRKLQDELLEKHIATYACKVHLWNWLLKNRVELVEKHYKLFFEKCGAIYHCDSFLYEMNKMHYTTLPRKFRASALQILKESLEVLERRDNENSAQSRKCHLALLSLSFQPDFMEIINHVRIVPQGEGKVNVFDESFRTTFTLREYVLEWLRNYPCSEQVMPLIMRFCYKDYFNAAFPTLTIILHNLPQRLLAPAMDILRERSVSVRRKALYFSTTLDTALKSCEALKYAGEHEKNKSLQKFIINRTFKNFCIVCNTPSWELLMDHFRFVFENDHETHIMLLQFNLIPRTYLALYVEKVWYCIGKQWGSLHTSVLKAINSDVIPALSDALCDGIIHFNLRNSKELVSSDVDFIYEYLLSSSEKIDHRFDLFSNNTLIVCDENPQLDFKEFNKKSQNVCFLYKDICRRLMCSDNGDTPSRRAQKIMLADKLERAFPNLPLPFNHLDYQVQIEICKCYLNDFLRIPELIVRMQTDVVAKHGQMMIQYFNDLVASQHLCADDVDAQISFVQKILEFENSTAVKLLAINLMPGEYPSGETSALHFRHLIEEIEADSAPVVSMFLNRYLKNLSV